MKRVALMVPSLSKDDAVGNDVLGQYNALRADGLDVAIFAEHHQIADPVPQPSSRLLSYLDRDSTLIYHLAAGWDKGRDLFHRATGRRVIRYHNVTPPKFFARFSKEHEASCDAGRRDVAKLKDWPCHRYWGASGYNCTELQDHGVPASQCDVLPPFHHVDRLQTIDADPNVMAALEDGKTNILMVGRMAPNKGHAAALTAFATYFHNYNCRSRLLLVGAECPGLGAYMQSLRRQVWELGIVGAVEFIGKAPIAALKAYYLKAHTLLVTSEHEGFCVPLIEAMAMKVPVVALDTTAIGETLGGAGISWKSFDAGRFAESIHRLARDEQAARTVGLAGWRRYHKNFTQEVLTNRFLETLREGPWTRNTLSHKHVIHAFSTMGADR